MHRGFFTLFVAASIVSVTNASRTDALELPTPEPVEKYLGETATGPNYTVKPLVRSDGVMRIFDVDTPYGQYAFDGVEFTKLRIHELNAIAAIEKMSQSEEFGKAFGRAALGPIKFGADLITNPAGTVERSLSGIGNMFDRVGAGLSNNRADRDGFVDSLLGVSDTQRELAVDLDVDPYTDFLPLAQKLKEMAGVMAGGGLPVKAGLSFVPGGLGIAVSSVATVSDARDTLRSKTAAQVIAETRATLLSLGISDENVSLLVENRNYTPADLLIMARALKKLNAENTTVFVEHAAGAGSRNVAFYHRRRAQILAARSDELGGIISFVNFGGQPINVARDGNVVAAFTVDDIAWTDVQQRTFFAATSEIHRMSPGAVPVLATTGAVTPMAAAEIGQHGWKIVHIKP
ncbi:MAG TPA: hypothetical protein VM822_22490 [Pseudolabrys sp.]|jgi:hypothetical protein|nr:hypothetical protein [Pseudolabrys sp.]